jgi:hypothetical protein
MAGGGSGLPFSSVFQVFLRLYIGEAHAVADRARFPLHGGLS